VENTNIYLILNKQLEIKGRELAGNSNFNIKEMKFPRFNKYFSNSKRINKGFQMYLYNRFVAPYPGQLLFDVLKGILWSFYI